MKPIFFAIFRVAFTCPFSIIQPNTLQFLPRYVLGSTASPGKVGFRIALLGWSIAQWTQVYTRPTIQQVGLGHLFYFFGRENLVSMFSIDIAFHELLYFLLLYLISCIKQKSELFGKRIGSGQCMICLDDGECSTFCGDGKHLVHKKCMNEWYRPNPPRNTCPMCRRTVSSRTAIRFEFENKYLYAASLVAANIIVLIRTYYQANYWKQLSRFYSKQSE